MRRALGDAGATVFRDDVGHMLRAGCERVVAALAPHVQTLVAGGASR